MILQQTHLIDRRIPAVVVASGVLLTADGLTSFATLVTQGIEVKPETGVEFKGVTRDELLAAKKMAEDLRVLDDQAHEAFGQFIEAPQKEFAPGVAKSATLAYTVLTPKDGTEERTLS